MQAAITLLTIALVGIGLALALYDMLKAQPSCVRTDEGYVQI